jgi:histone deacetylase 1/2
MSLDHTREDLSDTPEYTQAQSRIKENNRIMIIRTLKAQSQRTRKKHAYRIMKIVADSYNVNVHAKEPLNYRNATKEKVWQDSIKEEFGNFMDNKVIQLDIKPKDRKHFTSWKWVFKNKVGADGKVERHKSRLVVKGFTQTKGIDYWDTFAPVVNAASFRAMMTKVASEDYNMHQYDVKGAFTIPEMKFLMYAKCPEGYVNHITQNSNISNNVKPHFLSDQLWKHMITKKIPLKDLVLMKNDLCVRVLQSVYGTKQGAHDWNKHFNSTATKQMGFTPSETDPCIYYKNMKDGQKCYICLYTDDILFLYPMDHGMEHDRFQALLSKAYTITDKGIPEYFIGMKITRDRTNRYIYLSQLAKIEQLLVDTEMQECKTAPTPMQENLKLYTKPEGEEESSLNDYRSIIGSLIYIAACTRPDIAFSISKLAQFMQKPYTSHHTALKRVLRYLKGTQNLALRLGTSIPSQIIQAYADADWANDADRRSISGMAVFYDDSLISWKSKKQKLVALSSTEAELYSLSATVQEAMWTYQFLTSLGIEVYEVKLMEDNQSTIALVLRDSKDTRTKHVDVKHKFIGQVISKRPYSLSYVCTDEQVADIFTKPLGRVKFEQFRLILGLIDLRGSFRDCEH